jgi:hypothetical protein
MRQLPCNEALSHRTGTESTDNMEGGKGVKNLVHAANTPASIPTSKILYSYSWVEYLKWKTVATIAFLNSQRGKIGTAS